MAEPLVAQIELDDEEAAARAARFPAGAAIAFADLEEHHRADALDRLRAAEPVSWVPALGGWLVTSYPLARDVLCRRRGMTVWAEPNLVRASLGVMMLTTDAAEHDRQRAPFDEPFRMRSVRDRFESAVAARVDELAGALATQGECELGKDFAAPFAVSVAGDILGLSLEDVGRIRGFYDAFAGAMVYDGDPGPQQRADVARAELTGILLAEISRGRHEPDGSVTSAVANDDQAGLTDDEVAAQLRVILFGAIETVESAILNTILLLLTHPEQLAAVRADPALLPNAVEESLRLIPPVAFIERWTSEPAQIGGVELGAGEFVGISTLAANRDAAVFPDPLRYDAARENARHHLAFSFGLHYCLGVNMARMQIVAAVRALLERLPALELAETAEPHGFAFRKPAALRLRWAA